MVDVADNFYVLIPVVKLDMSICFDENCKPTVDKRDGHYVRVDYRPHIVRFVPPRNDVPLINLHTVLVVQSGVLHENRIAQKSICIISKVVRQKFIVKIETISHCLA